MPVTRPLFRAVRRFVLAAAIAAMTASGSSAQTSAASSVGSGSLGAPIGLAPVSERPATTAIAQGASRADSGWNVGLYPVFVWVPSGIDIDVELPPDGGGDAGSIVDGRFDGAYLGGFYLSRGWFRVDADGVWAGIGGDRVQTPTLRVDADLIYFHATGGVRLVPGLYATAGVRRLALKYNIQFASFPEFERKPGLWDPVIGVGYHLEGEGRPFEIHATFEGGGFGVGADQEYGLMGRVDWKPFSHFGLTGGYSLLHLKFSNTVANRAFTVRQTVQGPIVGIGLYF
jgi:hypothetical protein